MSFLLYMRGGEVEKKKKRLLKKGGIDEIRSNQLLVEPYSTKTLCWHGKLRLTIKLILSCYLYIF